MYQCLKQLYYACNQDETEYVSKCLSVLKGRKIEGDAASDLIAMYATSFPDSAKIIKLLKKTDIPVKRAFCKTTLDFMEKCGVHCDCGDCPHCQVNKYHARDKYTESKIQSASDDRSIISWCLIDREFYHDLVITKDFQSLLRRGLFCSKIYLVDEQDYSFSLPVYQAVFQYMQKNCTFVQFTEERGGFLGVPADLYHEMLSHISMTIDVPEIYRDSAVKKIMMCLTGLLDPENLISRIEAQNILNNYREGELFYEDNTVASVSYIEYAKKQLEQQDQKERNLSEDPVLKTESSKPQTTEQSETVGEKGKPQNIPRREKLVCIYDLPEDTDISILEGPDLELTFDSVSHAQKPEIPCELVVFEEEVYLLLYFFEKYYLIACDPSVDISKYIIPICFLPFGILSYYTQMRSIRSIFFLYTARYTKEYMPGPLGVIKEILNVDVGDLLTSMKYYADCFNQIKPMLSKKNKQNYDEQMNQAVLRSSCYFLKNIGMNCDKTKDTLFSHDGLTYKNHYNLYSVYASNGYSKFLVTIKNLKTGCCNSLVNKLADTYCSHAYFKDYPFTMLGVIEEKKKFVFLVSVRYETEFLNILYLKLPKYCKGMTDGPANILIEKEG